MRRSVGAWVSRGLAVLAFSMGLCGLLVTDVTARLSVLTAALCVAVLANLLRDIVRYGDE